VLDGEVATGTAEARHDLVDDQQHPVAPADLGHGGEVVVGRHQHAAGGADHRLGDERRHRVGALGDDHGLEGLGIVPGHVGEVQQQAVVARPAALVPPGGQRGDGDAVVGGPTADHLPPARPAGADVVGVGQADGRVGRLRPARAEADPGEPRRQPRPHQAVTQGHPLGSGPRRNDVVHVGQAGPGQLGHLGPAVADVGHDRAACPVEDAPTVGGDEVAPLGATDAQRRRAGDERVVLHPERQILGAHGRTA
jgi:hypothetical protein